MSANTQERILVTGGAGFIGYHVCQKLLESGKKVIIIDNFNNYYEPKLKEDRIKQLSDKSYNDKNLSVYKADISNFNKIKDIIKKNPIDKICHLAAQAGVRYSLENPFAYEKSNILGTLNMLEIARQFKIKDFIFASSSSVYGNNKKFPFSESDSIDHPISLYAATKKSTELMAYTYHHLYGINCTGLRFFTVYGPWGRPDMSYMSFTKAILEGKPIKVYNNGDMQRDFTYVEDIVPGVVAALEKSYPYEIFNLGNSKSVKLINFIKCVEKLLGKSAKKILLPMQQGDVLKTFADINKAKTMLGYNPKTDIEEGIRRFIKWYKEYYMPK